MKLLQFFSFNFCVFQSIFTPTESQSIPGPSTCPKQMHQRAKEDGVADKNGKTQWGENENPPWFGKFRKLREERFVRRARVPLAAQRVRLLRTVFRVFFPPLMFFVTKVCALGSEKHILCPTVCSEHTDFVIRRAAALFFWEISYMRDANLMSAD